MIADLHNHSYFSDGMLAPTEVARTLKAAGLQAVALSDHDTTAGVAEMTAECDRLGIINISAVEISAYEDCDVHILGYNVDCSDEKLQTFLGGIRASREERIKNMLALLAENGMPLEFSDVKKYVRSSLSRSHVARAMLAAGYETDFRACFDKWINYGSPCYVPNTVLKPEKAIEVIHSAGGKAVLAHPSRLRKKDPEKLTFIDRLAAAGLDGLEAVYKNLPEERVAFFRSAAQKNGLFVTVGGDFHAPDRHPIYLRELDSDAAAALKISARR